MVVPQGAVISQSLTSFAGLAVNFHKPNSIFEQGRRRRENRESNTKNNSNQWESHLRER